jgi:hypothetical protein
MTGNCSGNRIHVVNNHVNNTEQPLQSNIAWVVNGINRMLQNCTEQLLQLRAANFVNDDLYFIQTFCTTAGSSS